MRLIDADDLIESIRNSYQSGLTYEAEIFIEAIEEQPTAYDLDKVVERLENEAKSYRESAETTNVPAFRMRDNAKANAYKHAIEIVKAGGKEDE